jgi:hypothetical protein
LNLHPRFSTEQGLTSAALLSLPAAQGQEPIPGRIVPSTGIRIQRRRVLRMNKKKSKIDIAREIIANLHVEMNRPRVTESVRNGFRVQSVLRIKSLPVRTF